MVYIVIRSLFSSLLVLVISTTLGLAQDTSPSKADDDLAKQLEYPELMVTPSASDRLLTEAKAEASSSWTNYLPIQVSALGTLTSGFIVSGDYPSGASQSRVDNTTWASRTAMGIGGAWLVVTGYMAFTYSPYRTGYVQVRKMPENDKRSKLAKERLSEEVLVAAARTGKRLKWLSVGSNLAASLFVAAVGQRESNVVGGVSALLALTPLMFEPRWLEVNKTHQRYKKRIYGPIAGPVATKTGVVPGVVWGASF